MYTRSRLFIKKTDIPGLAKKYSKTVSLMVVSLYQISNFTIGQWILIEPHSGQSLFIWPGVNWKHSHVHHPLYLLYWLIQSQSTPLAFMV